jgi:hypothetical protein
MINLTQGNIDTMLGYIGGLIGDLMPLILVVLGITIAFFIIDGLIIKKTKEFDDDFKI